MTSVQTMHQAAALLVVALAAITGCGPKLQEPVTNRAPYEPTRTWGVVPFNNESGTSAVNPAAMADAFMQQAQETIGIDAVPVNRVIAVMRDLDLEAVRSHGDALTIMNVLGLDGLVVGTVTAYDPYRPLKLGMAVQLYARDPWDRGAGLDARAVANAPRNITSPGDLGPPHPVAQAAGVFHAVNHRTLMDLRTYARGRDEPDSAYGDQIYLVTMDLYAQFVSYRLLQDLLASEHQRLALTATESQTTR